MAWAAYTTCFFGFLCAGEICIPSDSEYDSGAQLSFSDIAVDSQTNPTIMQVQIKSFKRDPFRKGVDIYLGRTHNSLCPMTATMAYLSARGDTAGPLFHFKDGKSLTRDRFVNKLRDTLVRHWYFPRSIFRPQFPSWCCYHSCPKRHPRWHYSTPW